MTTDIGNLRQMTNELIKELYIQTSNETAHGKEWAIGGLHNAKRFAELIVLECGDFVATALMKKIGQISASVIATDLVEHFGVNEE